VPLALHRTFGLALTSALLAFPSLALAKPADPGVNGQANKDVTAEAAPLPAPVEEQPQKTEPIKPVKVEGEKPVTQGTIKKAPAPTSTTQSAPTSTQTTTTTRRRSTTGTARSTRRGNRGGATRGADRADQVRTLNAEERAERRERLAAV